MSHLNKSNARSSQDHGEILTYLGPTRKKEYTVETIGEGDNFFNLHQVHQMILTRKGLKVIREGIKSIRDLLRMQVVQIKNIHGYRFQKVNKEETDLIKLHKFFMNNFVLKTRRELRSIFNSPTYGRLGFELLEKVGLVNYLDKEINTEEKEYFENEHEYRLDMLKKRIEVAGYKKMLTNESFSGGNRTPRLQTYQIETVHEQSMESLGNNSESESFNVNDAGSSSSNVSEISYGEDRKASQSKGKKIGMSQTMKNSSKNFRRRESRHMNHIFNPVLPEVDRKKIRLSGSNDSQSNRGFSSLIQDGNFQGLRKKSAFGNYSPKTPQMGTK